LLSATWQLRSLIRHVRPDVVHVHSFVAGFLARLPLVGVAAGGVAVVYQPHAWSFDLFGSRLFGSALRWWERWSSRRTDLLVANCADEVREGQQVGVSSPGRVLGVAVDVDRFRPTTAGDIAALRRELGLTSQSVALCLGRLARQKGQDLLVSAWERRHPEGCELVLVGPGDPTPLQALAPAAWDRSVSWRGERSDVERWLAAADVLVVPSRYETVALVVAEAMACGTPVVTTRFNGAEETVLAGPLPAGGAVVELGDMAGLLREVGDRLRDPDLHHAESRAARTRAETLFLPAAVAQRLQDAYLEAIALATTRQQKDRA
jgi:glycosyltransferase involved in cell wall biosynthesis